MQNGRVPPTAAAMKNRPFRARLGFAAAGISTVFRRERSFRTQCLLGGGAAAGTAAVAPGPEWMAAITLCVALVLALELVNAAIEYLLDCLHPELSAEIGAAKDAAAGAVLTASLAAAAVAALMLIARLA